MEIHRDVGFSIGLLMIRNKTIYILPAALNFGRNKKINFKSGGLQFYDSYDKPFKDLYLVYCNGTSSTAKMVTLIFDKKPYKACYYNGILRPTEKIKIKAQ